MAKLADIRKALDDVLNENASRNKSQGETRLCANYEPGLVEHYFGPANEYINSLQMLLPELYGDFQATETVGSVKMATSPNDQKPNFFGQQQLDRLVRDIDQVFEIRANSELQQPVREKPRRVFVTHGRAQDWYADKDYIENDVPLRTAELAQQPNLGCTVIVMTGDDVTEQGEARVRENVMHEIGLFQGRYGRDRVILLHQDNVNVPANLSGVVGSTFPQGHVKALMGRVLAGRRSGQSASSQSWTLHYGWLRVQRSSKSLL